MTVDDHDDADAPEPGAPDESEPPTDASPTGSVPRLFADRFLLGARRGTGVETALFEATDQASGRLVAVKIVHPDLVAADGFVDRFRSTMATVAGVRHPNLAEVLDVGVAEWNGRTVCYVVTEALNGGSVRDLRDRGRELTLSQAVMVGLDVCRGLDIAHRAGLVHGDLRPSSLVFGDDGRLRVGDLGLAGLVAAQLAAGPEGIGADRARYASPEEALGEPPGQKSDVYALCLCLVEAITGQLPFVGESAVATLANRVDKLMPVSADLGALAAVLERAGRPDPGDRSSIAEFGRALVQAAEKLPRPTPLPLIGAGLFAEAPPLPPQPTESVATDVAADGVADVAAEPTADVSPTADTVPSEMAEATVAADASADGPSAADGPPAPAPVDAPAAPAPEFLDLPMPPVGGAVAAGAEPGSPRRRRGAVAIAVALVAVALGVAAFFVFGRTPTHEVPAVAGLEVGEVQNLVSEFDWRLGIVETNDDTVPVGVVVGSDPPAGSSLAEGGTLTLTVSVGPALRELPDIVGLTTDAATALLAERGLVLQLGDEPYDETVPIGVVVAWTVPDQPGLVAGDTVLPGTTVMVDVSAGPAPRVVPDLTGLAPADATVALTELGLVATQGPDEFSSDVPAGGVMRQDPAPGTEVARGATVSFVVSKGPDLVPIPPLADLNLQQVTAVLTEAGLTLGQVKGDPAGITVLAESSGQVLVAGSLLPRGAAVDVTFAVPAPPESAAP